MPLLLRKLKQWSKWFSEPPDLQGSIKGKPAVFYWTAGGRPKNMAGLPDLGRDQMPSPSAPPSRPIHHSPSPTKQQLKKDASTVHFGKWERFQSSIWRWDPKMHAASLKADNDINRSLATMQTPGPGSKSPEPMGSWFSLDTSSNLSQETISRLNVKSLEKVPA